MNDKEKVGFAQRLLRSFCPPQLLEEIEGDLEQQFRKDEKQSGTNIARRRRFWNTLRFFRPGIILRRKLSVEITQFNMIRNYLIMALRVSTRQKSYSLINILGLSIGLASSFLIGLYVLDEISYDRHIRDAESIYRVGVMERFNNEEIWYTSNSSPLAEAMRSDLPEIVSTVRVGKRSNILVQKGDQSFVEPRYFVADSNFFSFFGFRLLEGNPKTCLQGVNKIVLSASAAKKYFNYDGNGDDSPVGKQLVVTRNKWAAEVTGIFADLPRNTHMQADIVHSIASFPVDKNDCWGCYSQKTYFKTTTMTSLPTIEKKLEEYANRNIIPRIEQDLKITHDQFVKNGDKVAYFIQPLTSIHLTSHYDEEFEQNGDLRYVIIFSIIAIFILVIACINFINLATARAFIRTKEVGVRKSIGAMRTWLVQQFMVESFVFVIISTVVAGVWVVISLAPFNTLTGKEFSLDIFSNPLLMFCAGSFMVLAALLAGGYPAFYLSSFQPASALKQGSKGGHRSLFRNSLVVFQFGISMALIISTLMIYKQLNLIQDQNLGFDKERVLVLAQTGALGNNAGAFKNELLKHQEFVNGSFSQALPPRIDNTFFVKAEGSETLVASYFSTSDEDFQSTMGFEMKSGRYFSRDFPSDTMAVVINETCAKLLGYEQEGKTITYGGDNRWNVIGIVKDFNFASLRSSIGALVLFREEFPREMAVRLAPGDLTGKVELLESIWKRHSGGAPFLYSFLDENLGEQYRSEQQMGKIFWIFTFMAVFIACLGLFGLITFAAGQRTKEIGIRKVLGASVTQVTYLLAADLLKLVIIAFVIAIPVTWYGMDLWLQGFVYRVNFDAVSVMIAGLAGVLIALTTVSYKSFRAASGNPVDSLKNE